MLSCILDCLYFTIQACSVERKKENELIVSGWTLTSWLGQCVCVCERKDINNTDKVKGKQSGRKPEKKGEEREISLLTSGWPLSGWPCGSPWWWSQGPWWSQREVAPLDFHTYLLTRSHTLLFIFLVFADTDRHAGACFCFVCVVYFEHGNDGQTAGWELAERETTHTFSPCFSSCFLIDSKKWLTMMQEPLIRTDTFLSGTYVWFKRTC